MMDLVIVFLLFQLLPSQLDLVGVDLGLIQFLLNPLDLFLQLLVLNKNVR